MSERKKEGEIRFKLCQKKYISCHILEVSSSRYLLGSRSISEMYLM